MALVLGSCTSLNSMAIWPLVTVVLQLSTTALLAPTVAKKAKLRKTSEPLSVGF